MRAALFVLLFSVVGMTKANPVDMSTAREVAMKFMTANTNASLRCIDDLQLVTTYSISRGDAAFYIFNTPNGFVIVSADDCVTPILGYSEEGQFDTENIPIQLQDYLHGFKEQIQYGIENHVDDETIARQWVFVTTTGRLNENRDGEVVKPLISAMWNQDCYYNAMCPEDENGTCGHCVTGCVATAMAQIMHYWGYPSRGTGSHTYTPNGYPQQSVNFGETTYDWVNMTDQLTETSTQAEVDAISTLLWHCGVAVNMGYDPYGSGTAPDSPIYALTTYFDYADDMHWESKQDDDSWISLLKADLNLGRPIYYGGTNTNNVGHAFVCDGYDVNNRFHFNWGWGGSSNGYFALNAIDYYYGQQAIIGLHPNSGTIHQVTASASPSDGGTVIGAGLFDIGSICTLTATANENYAFMYWTENDEIVSAQAEYSFCVRKDRDLVAHFATLFHVEVVPIPMEGGTVSGTGEFAYGSTCTLTATANEGFDFICWRKANGSVASTASVFSFTVTEAVTLTAVFAALGGEQIVFADLNVKAICVANWDTNGDGELSLIEAATVTHLGSAFHGNTGITSFEELQYFTGLTMIDDYAFYDCSNLLGSLYIPNSVTSIGTGAFFGCSSFIGVLTIPNTVTSIGNFAFYNCTGFTDSLTISNSVTTIGSCAFYNCSGFNGSLTIGDSVTQIEGYAFYNCSNFTGDLVIPNSVTSIGFYAFYNCTGFTGSLTLGNSVTTIGDNAFQYCSGFTGNLTIPNSVTLIYDYAFSHCSGFTGSLTIGDSVTMIGKEAFNHCGFTGSLTIPNSLISIGNDAFYDCSGFTGNLTIGNSVATIGNYAFCNCNGFTGSLTIPISVTFIGAEAFAGCSGFTGDLVIPNSVTLISYGAFMNCSGFTGNLTIPNSVTIIDTWAFAGCTSFSNLTIGSSVTAIGYAAFSGCSGFTGNLVIPNSVTEIGWYAFSDCSGFTGSLTIGNSVTKINGYAFQNCSSFTGDLVIPNSVTSLGNCAFYNCSSFSGSLTIGNSMTEIKGCTFYNCNGFTGNLAIPNAVTSIGEYAFYGCNGFTSLNIPNSVTSIGGYAFYCSGLTSIASFIEIPFAISTVFSAPTSIPVYVPCGTVEDYKTTGWNRFDNIIGMCSGEIAVIVNPSEGGMVTGVGYYTGGDICVLTATPNPDFVFVNWIDNGLISTDSVYSFYAHPATIIANFCSNSPIIFADANVKAICVANWDTNDDGELSYVEAAFVTDLGEVFKNTLITSFNELQYFVNLTAIGSYAFYYCYNLNSIEIPNSVINIDSYAFSYCSNLASIEIPNSVTTIGGYAFSGCGLASIEIPNSVTWIRFGAFQSCNSLTLVEIPNSVTNIETNPFNGCTSLCQIIVDSDNTTFDSRGNCNAIIKTSTNTLISGCKNTVIPNSVTKIEQSAFSGCQGLTGSLIIPNSVTSIGHYAFSNCRGLTSLTIPNTVTSIKSYAFSGCRNLGSLNILANNPPVLGNNVFNNVNKSIPVYVPCGSVEAYQSAAYWNEFTNIQELCTQAQTITLSQGWNWFSPNIEITLDDLKAALVSSENASIIIKSKTQNIFYQNGSWRGNMSFDLAMMYKIYVGSACEITLEGMPINPLEHPITINNGPNWIGFPLSESMSLSDAFAGFAVNGDIIKHKGGSANYLNDQWRGSFNLEPGQGYIYNSNAEGDRILTFPSSAK